MSSNFLKELPAIEPGTIYDNRHAADMKEFGDIVFNVVEDGFSEVLEEVGKMPTRSSLEVKSSPLGVGYELLDHRCGYDFDKTIPIMAQSGVKWARLQSGWPRAEQVEGVYDFGWLDHIVDSLRSIGIQPWISLSFGNKIYMDAEGVGPHKTLMFSPTAFGERGIRGWENYCKAMTEHFKGRVSHWEVWNEPNAGFLRKPDIRDRIVPEEPEVYAHLVAITEKAVHSVDPEAKIIAGSISGGGLHNGYIRDLFTAGIAEHIDIFSYHPYGSVPELYWPERLQYIKDLIEHSGKKIEIWQGENGRPSDWNITRKGWKYTQVNQAKHLTRRYLTDLKLGITMSSYFLCCDIGNGYNPEGKVYSQGVIDANDENNYKPKVSFRAMQNFARIFDSETQKMNINLEVHPYPYWSWLTTAIDPYIHTTAGFRNGNVPIYAYYHPSHIDSDYRVHSCTLELFKESGLRFDRPILIDPITSRIYQVKKFYSYDQKGDSMCIEMRHMPLLDYPLFLTDASIFDEA